jgi:hypothetical protein
MKREMELQLQAWVDGELVNDLEVRACERWVNETPEAGQIVAALRATRAAIADGELPRSVPETREFYWSKIQRSIQADERSVAPTRVPGWWQRLLRLVIPAGAVAAVALLVLLPPMRDPARVNYGRAEIDTPLEDISGFSFRSDADGMNVVWVGTK